MLQLREALTTATGNQILQRDVGHLLNFTNTYIADIERGKVPGTKVRAAVCEGISSRRARRLRIDRTHHASRTV